MQNASRATGWRDAFCPTLSRKKVSQQMPVYHYIPRTRNRLGRQLNHQAGSGNVVRLRHPPPPDSAEAFQALTHKLVMAQHEAGTLNPGVVQALLLGVGLRP